MGATGGSGGGGGRKGLNVEQTRRNIPLPTNSQGRIWMDYIRNRNVNRRATTNMGRRNG